MVHLRHIANFMPTMLRDYTRTIAKSQVPRMDFFKDDDPDKFRRGVVAKKDMHKGMGFLMFFKYYEILERDEKSKVENKW